MQITLIKKLTDESIRTKPDHVMVGSEFNQKLNIMTMEKENVITTIKAELVPGTEFHFNKDQVTGRYSYDFWAIASVKIGTSVKEIRLRAKKEDDGTYSCEMNNYHNPFAELEKVGIEIDVTQVVEEYAKQVALARVEDESIRVASLEKQYKESWIHAVEEWLKASSKRPAGMFVSKSELKTQDDRYFSQFKIHFQYNGVSATLDREKGGFKLSYTNRVYSTAENAMLKFAELVTKKQEALEYKKATEIAQDTKYSEIALQVSREFDCESLVKKEYISDSYRRYGSEQYEHRVYLKINGKEYRIIRHMAAVEKEPTKYSFGFSNLSKEQVKDIVATLKKGGNEIMK